MLKAKSLPVKKGKTNSENKFGHARLQQYNKNKNCFHKTKRKVIMHEKGKYIPV